MIWCQGGPATVKFVWYNGELTNYVVYMVRIHQFQQEYVKQSLEHNRCSINVCGMNQKTNQQQKS